MAFAQMSAGSTAEQLLASDKGAHSQTDESAELLVDAVETGASKIDGSSEPDLVVMPPGRRCSSIHDRHGVD